MADLKSGSTVGGSVILTQGTFPLIPSGNSLSYNGFLLYSENDKPTKADVGLDQVNNWGATSATNNASDVLYATAGAVKRTYDLANSKLDADGLVQVSGYDPKLVMSQKAVTDNLDLKLDKAGGSITGPLTVGSSEYSGIDLKQNTGRYVRIENTPHGAANFLRIFKREADGTNIASFDIPAGFGTAATQQWVDERVRTNDNSTWLVGKNGWFAEVTTTGKFRVGNNSGVDSFIITPDVRADFSGELFCLGNASVWNKQKDARIALAVVDNKMYMSKYHSGAWQGETIIPDGNGTLATREWTNVWVRNGGANTETILQARENPGESFMFLRSNDHNIGFSLQGATKFRITPTAITTETGLRTIAINGTDNSNSNRPQLILDSKADLWRMEPDGAGKLQLVHPVSGALYEFEKTGGTQQVASKQWVNTNYHSSLAINNYSANWLSMKEQPCLRAGNMITTASASTIVRQEHQDRYYMLGGLGNTQFGIYMINKNQTDNSTNGAAYLRDNGTWQCNGNGSFMDVEVRSDLRKKSELVTINSALTKLKTLTGYTYLVEDEYKIKHTSAGLIAQDVQKVLPEIVKADDKGFLTMTYNGIHALVIEAIKELSDRVEKLEVKYGD